MTSIDGELLDEVQTLLLAHPKDDPITSDEVGDELDIDDSEGNPKAREVIRVAIEERDLPVAAGSKGYFYLSSTEALEEYLDSLDGRIDSIQDRKRRVAAAWNKHHRDPQHDTVVTGP